MEKTKTFLKLKNIKKEDIKSHLKRNRIFYLFFVLFAGYNAIWLAAFYPAVMSPDSFSHWVQSQYFIFNNAHPYIYSLLIWFLRKIYNWPSVVSVFQIISFSFFISFVLNYFWKKGINKIAILITYAGFFIWPVFAIYNLTIWKDVLYSIFAVSTTLLTALVIADKDIEGARLRKVSYAIILLGVMTMLLRHNGSPFLYLNLGALFISKMKNYKFFLRPLIFLIVCLFFFNSLMPKWIKLKEISVQFMAEPIVMRAVGAIYKFEEKPNLTSEERETFKRIISEKDWADYYGCTYMNNLATKVNKSGFIKLSEDKEFMKKWHKNALAATLRNPDAFYQDKYCLFLYLSGHNGNPYKYYLGLDSNKGYPNLKQETNFNWLKEKLANFTYKTTLTRNRSILFWSIYPFQFMFMSATFVASLFLKKFGSFFYNGIILANFALLVLITPAADFRYIYFVFLGFLFSPLLLILESNN